MNKVDLNQIDIVANCSIGQLYGTNVPAEGFVIVTVHGVKYKVDFRKSHNGWILTGKENYEKINPR